MKSWNFSVIVEEEQDQLFPERKENRMRQPAELVNPYIGSISYMLKSTVPEVMLPYGMARSTPLVDECGDYFCNDHIRGYSLGDA